MYSQQQKTSKLGIDFDKSREKRHMTALTLRKKAHAENVEKKRATAKGADDQPATTAMLQNEDVPLLIRGMFSADAQQQLESTHKLRQVMSSAHEPPYNQLTPESLVKLVEFLSSATNEQLQFEAAWALTNVASGPSEYTRAVIQAGAVPVFVAILNSPACSVDLKEQSVWALGNIAGDGGQCRDALLSNGTLPPLLQVVRSNPPITTLRNAMWCLSNLCRGKPPPVFEAIMPLLPVLADVLLNCQDEETLSDCLWAFSYAADGPNERISYILSLNVLPRIVSFLSQTSTTLQTPALRTVGNIAVGEEAETQAVINQGALPLLHFMLQSPKASIRKECCWVISNILAGTAEQVQAVIAAGLIPPVINALTAAEIQVKKEAAWCIANAASAGTSKQVDYIVRENCIPPLAALLQSNDPKILEVTLEALSNILTQGQHLKDAGNEAQYPEILHECGGLEALQGLQYIRSDAICAAAGKLLTTFFEVDETHLESKQADASGAPMHNF